MSRLMVARSLMSSMACHVSPAFQVVTLPLVSLLRSSAVLKAVGMKALSERMTTSVLEVCW